MAMRDPNTGAVLRDRFHQARGSGGDQSFDFANLPRAQQERLASELVQSRGAPLTPQNLSIAHQYMMGGQLQQFGAEQQPTADDISQQIDTADAGGGGGAGRGTPTSSPRPAARPEDAPEGDTGGQNSPWDVVLQALTGAATGAGAYAAARHRNRNRGGAVDGDGVRAGASADGGQVAARGGLDGEIVEDGGALTASDRARAANGGGGGVTGINYPPTGLPRPEDMDLSGDMDMGTPADAPPFSSVRGEQGEFSSGRSTDTVQLTGGDNPTTITRNGDGSYTTSAPNQPQESLTVGPDHPLYPDMDRIFREGISSNRGQGAMPPGRITPDVSVGGARRALP